MKKLPLLLSLLLWLSISISGQVHGVDSLIDILSTKKMSSVEKLELYKNICKISVKNDQKTLEVYTAKGLELAEKEKDLSAMSFFYESYARMYTTKASLDTAGIYWNKMLDLAITTKNRKRESSAYVGLANLNKVSGKRDLSLEYFLKALAIDESIDDKDGQALILCNIGGIHRILGDPDRAIYYFERAKKIAKEIENPKRLMEVYYELGAIYHKKGEFDKALEYSEQSLELSRSLNELHHEIANLGGISLIYCYAYQDYDQAEKYAKESLSLAEKNQDKFRIYHALNDLAGIYREAQRYKECEQIVYRAWQMDSTVIGSAGKAVIYSIIYSNIHLGNREKAIYFLEQFKNNAERFNEKSLHESLASQEVRYETEKKELQIASLEKEKQLYTYLGIGGVLFAITLGIVLWQNIRNAKKEKQLIATQSVMDGEMSERTRLARDLHDRLSGNLSAVKIELNNAESLFNISNKLDSCIEEVRRVAHNLMPTSLQYGLKTALEDFAAQFPNVHFHFFGEDNRFEERAEFVIYCCANELVNNSLKHSGAENINLQLVQDNKHVTLTVQDDGSGYDEKIVKKGLGLRNIYDRVISCNGKIDVISVPDKGTETIIELKIK